MDSNNNPENLSVDELELRAQGHTGELPRQFSALSTLSLAFTITNSWIAYSAVFVIPLIAGGGPCVIYSLVVGFVVCSFITLGLAELASAFPTSGGQYQYVTMLCMMRHTLRPRGLDCETGNKSDNFPRF